MARKPKTDSTGRRGGATVRTTSHKVTVENVMNYMLYEDLDIESRKFVTWEQFERGVADLVRKIQAHQQRSGTRFTAIHAIPRGGLVLGVKLSYELDIPLVLDPAKVTPTTLVVDDCVVSGKTLKPFEKNVIAVLYAKPGSVVTPAICHERTSQQINFCWESRADRN